MSFRIDPDTEGIAKSEGLHGSMDNRSLCRARLSLYYRGSAIEGGHGRRLIDISGDQWKGLGGYYFFQYTFTPPPFRLSRDKNKETSPLIPKSYDQSCIFVGLCPKGMTPRTTIGRVGESICRYEFYRSLFSL